MNEKEAREIVEDFKRPGRYIGASGGALNEYYEAKGYLACLEGPEVKALREEIATLKRRADYNYQSACAFEKLLQEEHERSKALVEPLADLLKAIDHSATETLNGIHSRDKMPVDPDEAFVFGAHIFFKLIGKAYPKAQVALAAHKGEKP